MLLVKLSALEPSGTHSSPAHSTEKHGVENDPAEGTRRRPSAIAEAEAQQDI